MNIIHVFLSHFPITDHCLFGVSTWRALCVHPFIRRQDVATNTHHTVFISCPCTYTVYFKTVRPFSLIIRMDVGTLRVSVSLLQIYRRRFMNDFVSGRFGCARLRQRLLWYLSKLAAFSVRATMPITVITMITVTINDYCNRNSNK